MVESNQDLAHIYLEQMTSYVVFGLEAIIIFIIIAIVAVTLIEVFRISLLSLKKKEEQQQRPKRIREMVSRMLRGLLISLDFLVAADILKTILVPSFFELATLAVVVIIRILLNWSLSKELESQ
jgi:uncharacterized membrane protein